MSNNNVVVAVGGNALIRNNNEISTRDQDEVIADTCKSIVALVEAGYTPVVTHGNGPQVGFMLRRVELASSELPPIPLDILGADTQGATGYLFSRNLRSELADRGLPAEVAALVTQSVVDPNDPAFAHPTKPIGSFMNREEAERRQREDGWEVIEDSGRGWRRVVPSPHPEAIVEADAVRLLLDSGYVVIAGGGGGIPVIRDGDSYRGVEAVIDKDLASALLGNQLDVRTLIICTAVEQVYVDFGKPSQKAVSTADIATMRSYLADGQFGAGSMEPKVRAAIEFIENGGEKVIITSLEKMIDALSGDGGTVITK